MNFFITNLHKDEFDEGVSGVRFLYDDTDFEYDSGDEDQDYDTEHEDNKRSRSTDDVHKFSVAFQSFLCAFPCITHVRIEFYTLQLLPPLYALLSQCSQSIVTLFVGTTAVHSSLITLLQALPSLTCFTTAYSERFKEQLLISLSQHSPLLESIDIEDTRNITDRSIIQLANHCPNITSLNLAQTSVGDAGINQLSTPDDTATH